MNEIIISIISVVVTSVLLPLITYAGIKLTEYLQTKIKDEKQRQLLINITGIITSNVQSVFQTFVEGLKKDNKFNREEQLKALNKAREAILKELSSEAINYIKDNYVSVENWIMNQIESTIYQLKQ
jgi:ribosome-binding factor A